MNILYNQYVTKYVMGIHLNLPNEMQKLHFYTLQNV